MSDREIIQRIFEALGLGFEGSEFTVSKMGDAIFIAVDDEEWCLGVYPRVDQQIRGEP